MMFLKNFFYTYACRQPAIFAMSDNEQELSHQELFKLVLEQRKQLEETRKELGEFRSYVGSKMVPLEEKVFAHKRASYREREAEVERATKAFLLY